MLNDHFLLSELEWPCLCGHSQPEHTILGRCNGCTACSDEQSSDHPYLRCRCEGFVPAEIGEQPMSA